MHDKNAVEIYPSSHFWIWILCLLSQGKSAVEAQLVVVGQGPAFEIAIMCLAATLSKCTMKNVWHSSRMTSLMVATTQGTILYRQEAR